MPTDGKKPNKGLPTRKLTPSSKTIGETAAEQPQSTFGALVGKYIDTKKKSGVKRPRTLYIDDEVWTPAHGLLKSKISEFVEECLVEMLRTVNKNTDSDSDSENNSRGRNNFR